MAKVLLTAGTATTFQSLPQASVKMDALEQDIADAARRLVDTLAFAEDAQATLAGLSVKWGTYLTEVQAELDALVLDTTLPAEEAQFLSLDQRGDVATTWFNALKPNADALVTAIAAELANAPVTTG